MTTPPEAGRDFMAGMVRVVAAACAALDLPAPRLELTGGPRVALDGPVLRLPEAARAHYDAFGVLPTDVVRRVAFVLKREAFRVHDPDALEDPWWKTEATLFAEVFVRDHVLNA